MKGDKEDAHGAQIVKRKKQERCVEEGKMVGISPTR